MGRVHIESADELERLADEIDRVAGEVQHEASAVQSELGELGTSWRDEGYNRFQAKYEQSAEVISRFASQAQEFSEYLRQHAKLDRAADEFEV